MTTRRAFIGSAAAGAVAFPMGAMAARPSKPGITFGVLSETMLGYHTYAKQPAMLEETLRFFRMQEVDAMVILGDITRSGLISELAMFADVWNKVFPDGRGKGGTKVELLAVTGEHDAFGWTNRWKDVPESEQAKTRLNYGDNLKKAWKEHLHLDWELIWRKEVKGYTFIGMQDLGHFKPKIGEYFAKVGPTLKKNKPFFVLSHRYSAHVGANLDYCDVGSTILARALSPYPNAVLLAGHMPRTLADERSVWQGEYTMVNAGSYYRATADFANENVSEPWHKSFKAHVMDADKELMGQGGALLVQAYDDHVNVQRLHVPSECKQQLGAAWKLPVPAQPGGAFDYGKRKGGRRPPQFPITAKMEVEFCPNGHPDLSPSFKGKPCYCVTIPFAKTVKSQRSGESCRVFEYVVTAKAEGKQPVVRRVLAKGASLPESMSNMPTKCLFLASELAEGKQIKFTAVPRECFGQEGKPLVKVFLP